MLQPTTSPEQPPVVLIEMQGHQAIWPGVIAHQLGCLGQTPTAPCSYRGMGLRQEPTLGVAGVASDDLQGEVIDDLNLAGWLAMLQVGRPEDERAALISYAALHLGVDWHCELFNYFL